jgi:hypothetical protein
MQQPQNPAWMSPFLQFLMQGGAQSPGAGYNPFFNIYSPAPPGTSQTTTNPMPIAPPQAPPPPVMPPPSSATITPMLATPGVGPIGQIPPAPAGTVAAGQGGQGVAGAPAMGAVNPAAVPPFAASMPLAPSLAPTGSSATGGTQPGSPQGATWMYNPGFQGGQFTINGRSGQPQAGDMIQIQGGPLLSWSQFQNTYGPLPGGGSTPSRPQGIAGSQL